jgi:hypothetical protein
MEEGRARWGEEGSVEELTDCELMHEIDRHREQIRATTDDGLTNRVRERIQMKIERETTDEELRLEKARTLATRLLAPAMAMLEHANGEDTTLDEPWRKHAHAAHESLTQAILELGLERNVRIEPKDHGVDDTKPSN